MSGAASRSVQSASDAGRRRRRRRCRCRRELRRRWHVALRRRWHVVLRRRYELPLHESPLRGRHCESWRWCVQPLRRPYVRD